VVAPPTFPLGGAVEIRELRRSDRDSFTEVVQGSYGPFERMLGLGAGGANEFAGLFRPGLWFVLQLLRAFGASPIRFFVAVDGPTVVGTTLLLRWPNSGYVLGVGVRPSHRRRGLAGQMIERAETSAERHGREWAVLDVEAENQPAVTLYRARHYEVLHSAVWLRSDAPGSVGAANRPAGLVRAVGKSGRKAATAWCARRVPTSVTEVLPPNPTRLIHLESLGQLPGTVRETWSVGPSDSPLGYLAGYWRGAEMPGLLFLPALDPAITPADLVRLVGEGTEWLLARGSPAVVVAVPDSLASAIPVIEGLGFARQLTTLTMVRRLGTSPAGAAKARAP